MQSQVVIHRAPWVLPISRPVIINGAVAVQSGHIAEVGLYTDVCRTFPAASVVDYPDCVLLPALVNAHAHLELSNLAHLSSLPAPATFTGWIENMLAEREKIGFSAESVHSAALEALSGQHSDGVTAIADISNTGLTRELAAHFNGKLLCFKEYLGLRAAGVAPALQALQAEEDGVCTAHAPYSTHVDLLTALKKRAAHLGHVFPLHVAEPLSESLMMSHGRGEIPEFLKRRGFWDNSFQPTGIDNSGSVQYLHQLGVLDEKTLCVHCVHVSDKEIELLVTTGSSICLCPGSNRYLGVGKAPVVKYLQNGILPALGTDSLASNPEISIWREMQLLAEDYPDIDHADIAAMATLGGAAALGLEAETGTLEPGRQADFLAIRLPGSVGNADQLYSYLVTTGSGMRPEWITSQPLDCI